MNIYSIRYVDHQGFKNAVAKLDGSPRVTRDYDFNAGDERRLNQDEAYAVARERAAVSGKVQQVRRVDGPLLGQKLSLIQETGVDIVKITERNGFEIGDRVIHQVGSGATSEGVIASFESAGRIGDVLVKYETGPLARHTSLRTFAKDGTVATPFCDLTKASKYPVGTEIVVPKWPWNNTNLVIRRRLADGTWLVLFDQDDPSRVGKTDCHPGSAYKGRPFTDDHATLVLETYNATVLPTA